MRELNFSLLAAMVSALFLIGTPLPAGAENQDPDPTGDGDVVDKPAISAEARQWCSSVVEQPISKRSIVGKIHGQPFTPDRAEMLVDSSTLKFDRLMLSHIVSNRGVVVEIHLPNAYSIEEVQGKTLSYIPQATGSAAVTISYDGAHSRRVVQRYQGVNAAGLKLKFGFMERGAIAVQMTLRIPDADHDTIDGAVAFLPE